jgi:hypothetical protein
VAASGKEVSDIWSRSALTSWGVSIQPIAEIIIEAITAVGLPAIRRALAEPLRPLEPPEDRPRRAT